MHLLTDFVYLIASENHDLMIFVFILSQYNIGRLMSSPILLHNGFDKFWRFSIQFSCVLSTTFIAFLPHVHRSDSLNSGCSPFCRSFRVVYCSWKTSNSCLRNACSQKNIACAHFRRKRYNLDVYSSCFHFRAIHFATLLIVIATYLHQPRRVPQIAPEIYLDHFHYCYQIP